MKFPQGLLELIMGLLRFKELTKVENAFGHLRVIMSCVRQSCSRGWTKLGEIGAEGAGKVSLEGGSVKDLLFCSSGKSESYGAVLRVKAAQAAPYVMAALLSSQSCLPDKGRRSSTEELPLDLHSMGTAVTICVPVHTAGNRGLAAS